MKFVQTFQELEENLTAYAGGRVRCWPGFTRRATRYPKVLLFAGGKIYLLQSRPITTLKGNNLFTGEWNDSLTGDYLWLNANLTEATPDIMTPLTWSLLKILHMDAQPFKVPGGYPMVGNIGGHPYVIETAGDSFFNSSSPESISRFCNPA